MNESSLGAQTRKEPPAPSPYSHAGASLAGLAEWHRRCEPPALGARAQDNAAAGELPRVSTGGSFV